MMCGLNVFWPKGNHEPAADIVAEYHSIQEFSTGAAFTFCHGKRSGNGRTSGVRFGNHLHIVRLVCMGTYSVRKGGIDSGCSDTRSDDGSFWNPSSLGSHISCCHLARFQPRSRSHGAERIEDMTLALESYASRKTSVSRINHVACQFIGGICGWCRRCRRLLSVREHHARHSCS